MFIYNYQLTLVNRNKNIDRTIDCELTMDFRTTDITNVILNRYGHKIAGTSRIIKILDHFILDTETITMVEN